MVMARAIGGVLCLLGSLIAGAALAQSNDVAARHEMVRIIEVQVAMLSAETGIEKVDPRVLEAMREVPRHAFVPEPLRAYAYGDHPLPVSPEQNIAAPLLVALMTHLAAVKAGDVVFETGTDVGYQAALLSDLGAEVYSVELVETLADQAARLLKDLDYNNVHVQEGDGYFGWAAHAPLRCHDHQGGDRPRAAAAARTAQARRADGHATGAGGWTTVPDRDHQRRRRQGERAADHAGALLAAAGWRAHLMWRAFAGVFSGRGDRPATKNACSAGLLFQGTL